MQHRGPWRPSNEQRAPGWAVLGVVLGVLLAGLVAIPGCLNPRPEEDPSALDLAAPVDESVGADDGAAPAAGPVRETCEDNPFLAGCEPPSESPGANPAPPVNGAPTPAVPADAGAPDVSDAGGGDAGATTAAGSPLAE